MRLSGYSVAFLLAILLVSTTPIGTGAGMHQFDLLHPLFSHVHVVDGRVVSHDQLAKSGSHVQSTATNGPALGGASGLTDAGLGVSPASMPPIGGSVVPQSAKWLIEEAQMVAGREEPPPDPPPVT